MTDVNPIASRLDAVLARIRAAEAAYGRAPGSVRLLAVSKGHPADAIRACAAAGQRCFGESYLQEAAGKIEALADLAAEWHFIGHIQGNKTRAIAEHFAWVHSLDNPQHARRLNQQRPVELPPLNVCLQVNVSGEAQKGGLPPEAVQDLAATIAELSRLRLRGLMAIPAPSEGFGAQRGAFRVLRLLFEQLGAEHRELDTLSMGMSNDLEAAIAEGASIVRVGTAIFGPRLYPA